MIYQKIFITESQIKEAIEADMKRMNALENIKKLLTKVDNHAETIPTSNPERLHSLLEELKESRLSTEEERMLDEIVRA